MNRIFAMIVVGGVCASTHGGIWDNIKSVGKGVTDSVDRIVDATNEVATNSFPAVEISPSQSQSARVEQSAIARLRPQVTAQPVGLCPTQAPTVLQLSSPSRKGMIRTEQVLEETPNQRPNSRFRPRSETYSRQISNSRSLSHERSDSTSAADKNRHKKYHEFLQEWDKLQSEYESMLPYSADSENRVIRIDLNDADVEAIPRESAIESRLANRLYGNYTLRCPKTDALLDKWMLETRQAYAKERETLALAKKRYEKYYAFLCEWDKLQSDYEKLLSQSTDSENRVIRIDLNDSDVENISFGNRMERNQAMNLASRLHGSHTLRCPKTDALLDKWMLETRQAYAKERETLALAKKRYEKYHAFLQEWDKLQSEYEKMSSRFAVSEVSVIRIDLNDADVENISFGDWQERDQTMILVGRLQDSRTLRCPKTDALLEKWIRETRQAYAKACEKYETQIKWVEERLAMVRELKKSLIKQANAKTNDIQVIIFADGKESVHALHQTLLSAFNGLSDDVDSYLKDKSLRDDLQQKIDSINGVLENVRTRIANLQRESESIRALRQTWRPANSDTNRPAIGPVKLGASIYEAALLLCHEDYIKMGSINTKSETHPKRVYAISLLGQQGDVTLEFMGTATTQGVFFVRGTYTVPKSFSYDTFVKHCAQELGGNPQKKTEENLIGFDMDDLRQRNHWAAWQIEYYENRAKQLHAQNRQKAAAKQESLVNKAGKRYKAKELIVSTTTLSSNGYETRILSDIGGKTVDRVWIEDVTALKECDKADKKMKQEK